ncbi:MAG: arginine--tRNA ligase [Candidatus Marsarchaeota archaeon]|jgi:arginyl-tRNA synthetase|nr:arginine--tRNA ligase [Candidatus Marsarchaeota archaeon]MCL5418511.1 arginine--tRNA ligase [Candidatus Marsarchaeota archaeon]
MEEPYEIMISGIRSSIKDAIAKSGFSASDEDISNSIVISKMFGDISSSICFKISNSLSRKAEEIAVIVSGNMQPSGSINRITIEGGFLNFHIKREQFSSEVISYVREKLAKQQEQEHGSAIAMVEYPSVNPNKPWHIGHLRNALIGDVIANLLGAAGMHVIRTDYIDNLGLQVAESVWWQMKSSSDSPEGAKYDRWLGEEYVKANKFMEEHDAAAEINNVLGLMERDGTYESKLAREMAEACIKAQYDTAFAYGIYHDLMVWESDIVRNKILDKGLEILEQKGFAKKAEEGDFKGCIVIDLSSISTIPKEYKGIKESTKVLVRSNGVPTYLAKDIAFHMWKFGIIPDPFHYKAFMEKQPNGKPVYTTSPDGTEMNFGPAKIGVNIIDARQSYPQALVRLAFRVMGRDDVSESIRHLAYGEVEIESGSISGRKGTWMGYSADELLDEAKKKALQSMTGRFSFGPEEQESVSRSVGVAAIKFEFLKPSVEKKIVFSWERALNFEGNSGPYLQYMYARASRILEEAGNFEYNGDEAKLLGSEYEFALVKALSIVDAVIRKAAKEYRPSAMVEYAIELADLFAKFYEQCPVLHAEPKLRSARLALLDSFKIVMEKVLDILGIDALTRM